MRLQNNKDVSPVSITPAVCNVSVVLSAVVKPPSTVSDAFTKRIGILGLFIARAVLGVVARSKIHIILGIVAAVFPFLWFLLIKRIFGFIYFSVVDLVWWPRFAVGIVFITLPANAKW